MVKDRKAAAAPRGAISWYNVAACRMQPLTQPFQAKAKVDLLLSLAGLELTSGLRKSLPPGVSLVGQFDWDSFTNRGRIQRPWKSNTNGLYVQALRGAAWLRHQFCILHEKVVIALSPTSTSGFCCFPPGRGVPFFLIECNQIILSQSGTKLT